ncbi:hypothetical protein [Muricoccus radiodurans]|uniref:hypothetical protein n=1 Tax=Muricoccus radiodurans TaxID=2231721 RepID=UPI003CEE2B25
MPRAVHALSADDRAEINAQLRAFLSRHGVQPWVDPATGDVHVCHDELCRALGLTEEQLAAVFGKDELDTDHPVDTVPLQ